MKGFEKGYKLPLKYDGIQYVFDANGTTALQFEDNLNDPFEYEFRMNVVSCINTGVGFKTNNLSYNTYIGVIFFRKVAVLIIRGYGYLTGIGGLNLTDKEASGIQDSFAEYIVKQLSHEKDR